MENDHSNSDWRAETSSDIRLRLIDRMVGLFKQICPFATEIDLQRLKKAAFFVEGRTFSIATTQSDYIHQMHLRMLRAQNKVISKYGLQNSAISQASHGMHQKVDDLGQSPILLQASQSQRSQCLIARNMQRNMVSTGTQTSIHNAWRQNPGMENMICYPKAMGQNVPMYVRPQQQMPRKPISDQTPEIVYRQQMIMEQKIQQGNLSQKHHMQPNLSTSTAAQTSLHSAWRQNPGMENIICDPNAMGQNVPANVYAGARQQMPNKPNSDLTPEIVYRQQMIMKQMLQQGNLPQQYRIHPNQLTSTGAQTSIHNPWRQNPPMENIICVPNVMGQNVPADGYARPQQQMPRKPISDQTPNIVYRQQMIMEQKLQQGNLSHKHHLQRNISTSTGAQTSLHNAWRQNPGMENIICVPNATGQNVPANVYTGAQQQMPRKPNSDLTPEIVYRQQMIMKQMQMIMKQMLQQGNLPQQHRIHPNQLTSTGAQTSIHNPWRQNPPMENIICVPRNSQSVPANLYAHGQRQMPRKPVIQRQPKSQVPEILYQHLMIMEQKLQQGNLSQKHHMQPNELKPCQHSGVQTTCIIQPFSFQHSVLRQHSEEARVTEQPIESSTNSVKSMSPDPLSAATTDIGSVMIDATPSPEVSKQDSVTFALEKSVPPIERLIDTAKSMSPNALSAATEDFSSVISTMDRIPESPPVNGTTVGAHCDFPTTASRQSKFTEEPIELLIRAVESISPNALSAAVNDICSVMVDQIPESSPVNASEDLAAMTNCSLQATNLISQDQIVRTRKRNQYASAMSDTFDMATETSTVKRPRIEANHGLLDDSADAVVSEHAQQSGGETFSSKFGTFNF